MTTADTFSEEDLITRFPPGTVIGTPAFNRVAASNAMIDFFAKKDPSCVDRYFKTAYINHTTRAGEGIGPVHALAEMATKWDGLHIIVRRTVAQGDLVALHSVYSNLVGMKGQGVAIDLFRFEDGKIVEHWDALQDCVFPDESGLGQTAGSVDISDRGLAEDNRAVAAGYAEAVLVQGEAGQAGQFIDEQRYVDHSQPRGGGLTRAGGRFAAEPGEPQARYLRAHRTIAEGNFVLVHGEGRQGEDQVLIIWDLFRLESGRIVEHWDILQNSGSPAGWGNQIGPF